MNQFTHSEKSYVFNYESNNGTISIWLVETGKYTDNINSEL